MGCGLAASGTAHRGRRRPARRAHRRRRRVSRERWQLAPCRLLRSSSRRLGSASRPARLRRPRRGCFLARAESWSSVAMARIARHSGRRSSSTGTAGARCRDRPRSAQRRRLLRPQTAACGSSAAERAPGSLRTRSRSICGPFAGGRCRGPRPREHLAATALGGRVYALGGRLAGYDTNLAVVESYDPARNRWSRLPDLPDARGGTGAAALAGRIVSVGGESPAGTNATVWACSRAGRPVAARSRPSHAASRARRRRARRPGLGDRRRPEAGPHGERCCRVSAPSLMAARDSSVTKTARRRHTPVTNERIAWNQGTGGAPGGGCRGGPRAVRAARNARVRGGRSS